MPMRAYVLDALCPTGGAYMAYHIGLILQRRFGYTLVSVGENHTESRIFEYPEPVPVIGKEQMLREATSEDFVICNAFFSTELYGLRLPSRVLCYVQNIRTFAVLDVFFDHYVFVSEWVRRFVNAYYGIDGPVIPAFIDNRLFGSDHGWAERNAAVLVTQRKHESLVFAKFKSVYQDMFGDEEPPFEVIPIVPQAELARHFSRSRYFLSLDTMEGFGLPMLEAMASGCAVVGWDSGGCREYARPGWNCELARYGDLRGLARSLNRVLHDHHHAQALAKRGRANSAAFSYEPFYESWFRLLDQMLSKQTGPQH